MHTRGVTVEEDRSLRDGRGGTVSCGHCRSVMRARGYHQLGFSPGQGAILFMSFQTLVAVCEECGRVEFFEVVKEGESR